MLDRTNARKYLVAAALLSALVAVCLAPKALARISVNTIDAEATIADNGRLILVTGPVQNDQLEWNDQRVTITQRSTGAVAEGHIIFRGTTSIQQWEVEATVKGNNRFEPGPATAVALCASTLRGEVTDAHQWLVQITLVEE